MPLDENFNGGLQVSPLLIAASAQLVSRVPRNVLQPSLFSVEGDDADPIIV